MLFTWGMTALGAAMVFTTKNVNQKFLDSMLGFAGGVMIATSFWSLLFPHLKWQRVVPIQNGYRLL
jgi:ZIP family zinc transporter